MMFRIAAVSTFLAATISSPAVVKADESTPSPTSADTECTLCYDYGDFEFDLGAGKCSELSLFRKIKDHHKKKAKETGKKCRRNKNTPGCTASGLNRELMALTNTKTVVDARVVLQELCDAQLVAAAESSLSDNGSWGSLGFDMEDYMNGQGFLNLETGNFQQETPKRPEDFIYKGTDPRLNDHYPTTEESYQAGQAIKDFYGNEAKNSKLSAPTSSFGDDEQPACAQTNAAVCCWHRDRQYRDANGNCRSTECANKNPGDNTDLCWTEDNGEIFPYPGDGTENDLHCHGFAWGMESDEHDLNTDMKWNNLFFVSMYDHMVTRGYVESITNDPLIAGSQAMCGCVEEMAPIARADCTEIKGRTNTTLAVSGEGRIQVDFVPGSFTVEFEACRGYDYVEGFGPEDYEIAPNAAELDASNNDLSAFMYRLYLEGKIDEGHTEAFAETIIGYKNPEVNNGDDKREAACAAAFNATFPDLEYVEKEIVVEEDEETEI